MPIDQQEMKQLALIRFLYMQGLEQVARPAPLSAQALLSFHDAVEMFLHLAALHQNVSIPKNVDFEGYFGEIKKQAGTEPPYRPAMRRMNNNRVSLKHHGSIPSDATLAQVQADVSAFLTDATQQVFQADFKTIDMIDLVTQADVVAKLRQAETHAGQSDYIEALALLSEAFDGLLDDYANRKLTAIGTSIFTWWPPSMTAGTHPPSAVQHDGALVKAITDVYGALEGFQRTMRVVAMGIDYRRYARFQMIVPAVYTGLNGERDIRPMPGLPLGDDEYQLCRQFVIETSLHLAESDFDLDLADVFQQYRISAAQQNRPSAHPPA